MATNMMDRVRKWTVRFSGKEDPIAFVERLEELVDAYELCKDDLPRVMPEMLAEKGLLWYRNNNRRWSSWREFKYDFLQYFLPARYYENLEDIIRQRRHRPAERFKDYALHMQELMRHAGMNNAQCLERIFRNMATEYQLYIRRHDFSTLGELTRLAEEYELLQVDLRQSKNQVRGERAAVTQPPRNTRRGCFNCGDTSHWRRDCPNTQSLVRQRPQHAACEVCGREGVRTFDCCRGNQPGNANRRSPNRRN